MEITDYHVLGVEDALWVEQFTTAETMPLWEKENVPDYHGDQREPSFIFGRSEDENAKTCVVIFAGGSYRTKAPHEGTGTAQYLNQHGYHTAVVDYRCAPYSVETITNDAKRAIRLLRSKASVLGFDEDKIVVMGFSAGGNLAFRTALFGDDGDKNAQDPIERFSSRPNALVLGYPAVHFVDEYDDDDEFNLLTYFDVRWDESMTCPPVFYWQTMEDDIISMPLATDFILELGQRGVPLEFHLFPTGPHGQGLAQDDISLEKYPLNSAWINLCKAWLKYYGL